MKDDELRRRLRGAAHTHRPDRERMRARVERGMGGHEAAAAHRPPGPAMSWLRVVSATASVAGVFAVAGYAVASSVNEEAPNPQSVVTTSAPMDTPATPSSAPVPLRTSASPTTAAPRPTGTPHTKRPSDASRSKPSESPTAADLLWADGSIDPGSSIHWAQSNVTVKARKPLASLTVELRVALTAEVADTGSWRSLPAEDFDASVSEDDGFLVYRWTLRAGRTVPVGAHVFAGQYDHAQGQRNAYGDVYTVQAGTSGSPGEQDDWRGDFAPSSD
ncbi:hypothetical protein OG596_08330 [Streptomyces sp. NBC_01102]|uniref:hypothetical protein n=1 Tax=Streptomyces sp. NBC_01102 TaxID=2903749 RepID=UPI00386D39EE|nr:hypothetical protein OG596_08330 [Streptomyces sp. NBC_01102]